MNAKIKCTCGHSWDKSDSSKKDMNVCHVCGKDNTMKNGGWLDNYGKVDNANESDVSLPEGFVGMGYDTSGRNYSPSWNGQFQTGGSIPGTPGFTYARTAGSAPSEGKYAKKTMPSAQDGKTTVATSSPEYKQLYENRQIGRWLDDYNFDSQVPLDEVVVRGNDERVLEGMRNTRQGFLEGVGTAMSFPQQEMMRMATGKRQSPSEAWGFDTTNNSWYHPKSISNFAMDAILDPTNLVGVGLVDDLSKGAIRQGLQQTGEHLTTQTPLRNARKLNPFAENLNNPNKSYRVAGEDAYQDFLNTGVVKSADGKLSGLRDVLPDGRVIQIRRPTGFPSFQKGYADLSYADPSMKNYIYETSVPTFKRGEINPVTGERIKGRHYAHRPIDMNTGEVITQLPAKDVRVFESTPHWLKGYKEIPKKQNGGEMRFYQEGLDWKPKSMQEGGDVVSTSDPRYAELYKNRQLGRWLDENTFDSQVPLDEVTVRPQSYSMESLRDFSKAAMYGVPENLMKLEQIPTAALAETAAMLTGKPYDFANINPNLGQWESNQRDLSILGYENPEGFIQNSVNMGLSMIDPSIIIGGAGMLRKPLQKGTQQISQNIIRPTTLDNTNNLIPINNVVNPTKIKAWQMEELPGLHLKSTMEGEAISKIVEPKTGLINTEQALAIIGKESGGVEKVALIRQGLGDNIPKKMNFNEFRKITQDQLIPLEKQFVDYRSDYGIDRLGYKEPEFITRNVDGKTVHEMTSDVIENQTMILGNKSKFGRGSGAHGNPEETLGHAHFLRDAETPDVLTVTQIQSDAFQGTHRIMPSKNPEINKWEKMLTPEARKQLIEDAGEEAADLVQEGARNFLKDAEKKTIGALGPNPTQKQLLDKNHQERYLQELVDYAGKRRDLNKVRVPTSETAAKVQGYKPVTTAEEIIEKHNKLKGTPEWDEIMTETPDADKLRFQKVLEGKIKGDIYDLETTTILKKYAEQPKTIKKLFGKEPTIITDNKGNTWYEFDIPDKFKKGKGEIKAFSTIGTAGAAGIAATQLGNKKYGGIIEDDMGYWNPDNRGKPVRINSNLITMENVYEPLIGVSDTGDTKLMEPGKDYKFKGKKVTEYPLMQKGGRVGINDLDAQPNKKLNQLLNFTNNPDKNWLDNL
jgi:hypothetical protein